MSNLGNRTRLSPYTRINHGALNRQRHSPAEVAGRLVDDPVVSSSKLLHAAPPRRPFAPQFDARRALLSRVSEGQVPIVPVSYAARRAESESGDQRALQAGNQLHAEERPQGVPRTTLSLPQGVIARSR